MRLCTICGFPAYKINARDQFTCDNCQLELFPEEGFPKRVFSKDEGGTVWEWFGSETHKPIVKKEK